MTVDGLDGLLDGQQKLQALRDKALDGVDGLDAPSRVGARVHMQELFAKHPRARVYEPPSTASTPVYKNKNKDLQEPCPSSSPSTPVYSRPGGSLREKMPGVTAFLDEYRATFGADGINASIKNGLNGGSDFYASENSLEIGNRQPDDGRGITADKMDLRKIDPKTCDCPACKQARLAGGKGSPRGGRGRG